MLVSYYYYAMPLMALWFVYTSFLARENFDPMWPLAWVEWLSLEYISVILVLKLAFVAATLGAVFFHHHRWARILLFVALWQVHAFESSFLALNHQWYLLLYTSCIFIFLPNIWHTDIAHVAHDARRRFLLFIWGAQAIVMLTYTLAGLWKFVFAYGQYMAGEVHTFAMEAFAYQVANWGPRLQEDALLAPFIINNPEVAWPFYALLPFLQLFAIWVMVRPSLQRVWAVLLILFHIGTFLAMHISFTQFVFILAILFFNSPFVPARTTARELLYDLPVIGHLLSWRLGRR